MRKRCNVRLSQEGTDSAIHGITITSAGNDLQYVCPLLCGKEAPKMF